MVQLLTISISNEYARVFERIQHEPNKSRLISELLSAHYAQQIEPAKPKTAADLTTEAEAQEAILQHINAERNAIIRKENAEEQARAANQATAQQRAEVNADYQKRSTVYAIESMLLSNDQRKAMQNNAEARQQFKEFTDNKAREMSEEAFRSYVQEYTPAYKEYSRRKQEGD